MDALVIDIGNTRTKIGVFRDDLLIHREVWTNWQEQELWRIVQRFPVKALFFCSVAHTPNFLHRTLPSEIGVHELTHHTVLPFTNLYQTPHTLGKDRLAAVAGAQSLWRHQHVVVIDSGTCVKYEALTAAGKYLGGNIAPGAAMRTRAMHHFTQRLPDVPLHFPDGWIGHSTETALQNGALRGMLLEMSGFVRTFAGVMQDLEFAAQTTAPAAAVQVVLTGGDAALFTPLLTDLLQAGSDFKVTHTPDLTLYGLHFIFSSLS